MKKNFVANLIFLILLNMLVKPFWILGIDRNVQNAVGTHEYGIYFSLFSFSFLFQIILDFGINNFNNRHIAQHPERLPVYFSTSLIAKLLFAVLYGCIVFIFAFGVKYNAYQLFILLMLVFMQVLMSFYTFLRSNVAALHLFKTDAVLSVLDKIITSALCATILWGNFFSFRIHIKNFIGAQIAGYIIACAIALYIILKHAKKIQLHFQFALLKEIIRNSYPFALLGFLMAAYYRIDTVMIERMLGTKGNEEVGIYASAFRLLDAMSILGYLFAGILMPMFSRMIKQKENVFPLLELSFKIIFVLSVTSGITFLFYRNNIMETLYTGATNYYGSIFGWLMISFINICIIFIYGSLLTANGSLRVLNLISAGGLILNVIINLFLIPQKQALGAAVATVFTQVFVMAAHIFFTRKIFHFSMHKNIWLRSGLFLFCFTGLNFLLVQLQIYWVYSIVLCLFAGSALALFTGLFRIKEIAFAFKTMKQNTPSGEEQVIK